MQSVEHWLEAGTCTLLPVSQIVAPVHMAITGVRLALSKDAQMMLNEL